jgi:hypothetical protein
MSAHPHIQNARQHVLKGPLPLENSVILSEAGWSLAACLRTFWAVDVHTIWSGQREKQRAPTNAGALVFTKKKKGSVACRGAPVEAVIDPALHHVDLFGGAYERRAEDTRGEGDTIDANVGVTEVKVLVFDLG